MDNFKYKLIRFMCGRYGMDELSYGLFAVYFILMILNIFFQKGFINILIWVILFLITFRTFSRNISKRRMEKEKFMKIWKPLKSKGSLSLRRIKEIKTHRYRKCPHCKAILRLPRKTGKNTVRCPRCTHEFDLKILW